MKDEHGKYVVFIAEMTSCVKPGRYWSVFHRKDLGMYTL